MGELVLTECPQGCDAPNNIKKVRTKCGSITAMEIRDVPLPSTYYSGLLASRSSNRSCLEVRK